MKTKMLFWMLSCIILIGCGKSEEVKSREAAQRAYEADSARVKAIWDANPGGELAALKCSELADTSEAYQKKEFGVPRYSKQEVYQTCMRDKGFGQLFK